MVPEKGKESSDRAGGRKERVFMEKNVGNTERNQGESDVGSNVKRNKMQPSSSDALSEGKEMSNVSTPKNMSELKVMNSSFEEFKDRKGVMPRSQSSFLKSHLVKTEKAHPLFVACVGIQDSNFSSSKKTVNKMD